MASGAPRRALTACLLAGVLSVVGGCAAGATTAPPAPTAAPVTAAAVPATAGVSDDDGGGRRGRGGDGAPAAAALPADFPSDVPLPPGELQATSGSAGQWSALLRVPGSASDALRSAMQFYVAAGFTQDSPSTAHRGRYTTTLVTENRDHSPTSTNLVVGVAAR
jgi:hypothetical protein